MSTPLLTGFILTVDQANDPFIVTQFSAYLSREQETTKRVSYRRRLVASREATAEEATKYLARSPHWAHLMRMTLEMDWTDVYEYLGKL
jgi:hypothetical protein